MATLGFYLATGATGSVQPLPAKAEPTTANSAGLVLDMLAALGNDHAVSIGELASKTSIETASLEPILSDLKRNGLIEAPEAAAYKLTDYGEKMRFIVSR